MVQKRIRLVIEIQSYSDVITNSSSELFVIKNNSNQPVDSIRNLIESYARDHYFYDSSNFEEGKFFSDLPWKERIKYDGIGGCGGKIEVKDYDLNIDYKYESKRNPYLNTKEEWRDKNFPEVELEDFDKFILINIDDRRYATMDFIMKTFDCYCLDVPSKWMILDKTTKKVIGIKEDF